MWWCEGPIFVEIVCPNQIFIASSAAPLSSKYLSKLVGNTASHLLVKYLGMYLMFCSIALGHVLLTPLAPVKRVKRGRVEEQEQSYIVCST